ncbi:hypothetical protein LTR37_007812 [Vermiconidia calcicola]|uniref:Uncharacterized protein n=1 Tax=Vermiconidia calcicola TaxID=1690605 RepID=A0ACC3NCL7_9PEZI|nr:hypothetical protein LTR37_007812 [Vermiconidia calcicola]
MATKLASFGGPNPHTSGLFSDMTVDGPEIGTLVLIVDRAKNLPNRKTMGKQNPYCAGRLGKEAKKTETDRRGGQTPKWDQELRFTVHDSPDYNKLKISIFSEDKKTVELIGEAWVNLTEIIVPGGGKGDHWQGLMCKGKYAGELRLELTYYDSRPKPEAAPESAVGAEDLRQSAGCETLRVKRRPLPSNPNSRHATPDTIQGPANPGRAKHGPRDLRMPSRTNSMPPETVMNPQPNVGYGAPAPANAQPYRASSDAVVHQAPPDEYYDEYDQYQEPQGFDDGAYAQPQQPDFLPQLPPSNRQRGAPPQAGFNDRQRALPPQQRPHHHMALVHSQSAPVVPQANPDPNPYGDEYQLRTDYPEPIPDLEYQHQQLQRRSHDDIPWQNGYNDAYADADALMGEPSSPPPPPPPVHSISAPVVPHYSPGHGYPASTSPLAYGTTPPSGRHHSVPNSSPLQTLERSYGPSQRTPIRTHPARGSSVDGYTPPPDPHAYESPPASYPSGQGPSPYPRAQPVARTIPHRNTVADPYQASPSRPHPLSQEVPRPRSPQPRHVQSRPGYSPQPTEHPPYRNEHTGYDPAPTVIKPLAISPRPTPPHSQSTPAVRPRSSYNIQHPVRAFESSDNSPLSTPRPSPGAAQMSSRTTPLRKSVSPHPSPANSTGGGLPFSPDSFDVHNPHAQRSTLPQGNSPHTPYQVSPSSANVPREGASGPIVGWHGQEIDPSDHLPVDSWAPEPEVKIPNKTYGLGRDRDFGPRHVQAAVSPGARNLSKDTVVKFRTKSQPLPPTQPEPDGRNRLQKKTASPGKSPIMEPLGERHNFNAISVPDPYAQQEYSRGFYQSSSEQQRGYSSYAPPSVSSPSADGLAREISTIDIGAGRHSRTGSVPTPTAYVPVRSHRDRNTFY